jgi:hypothetical protein
VGLETTVLLRTWLKALPNLPWVGLPAAALVGEPEAAALSILFGEENNVMVDLHFCCDLWKCGRTNDNFPKDTCTVGITYRIYSSHNM